MDIKELHNKIISITPELASSMTQMADNDGYYSIEYYMHTRWLNLDRPFIYTLRISGGINSCFLDYPAHVSGVWNFKQTAFESVQAALGFLSKIQNNIIDFLDQIAKWDVEMDEVQSRLINMGFKRVRNYYKLYIVRKPHQRSLHLIPPNAKKPFYQLALHTTSYYPSRVFKGNSLDECLDEFGKAAEILIDERGE